MNNGVYFSEFERGTFDWLWRVGRGFPAFNKQYQCNIVLTGLATRIRREIGIFRMFQVHTKLIHFDEKHLYLEQRIMRHGFVYCAAFADLSVVNQKTGRRTTTTNFIKFIGLSEEGKMEMRAKCPQSMFDWLDYLRKSSAELRAGSGLTPIMEEDKTPEERKRWRRKYEVDGRLSSRWSF